MGKLKFIAARAAASWKKDVLSDHGREKLARPWRNDPQSQMLKTRLESPPFIFNFNLRFKFSDFFGLFGFKKKSHEEIHFIFRALRFLNSREHEIGHFSGRG